MLYKLYTLSQRINRKLRVIFINSIIRNKMRSHQGTIIRPHELKGLKYISVGKDTIIADGAIITAHDNHNGQNYSPEINIGDRCCLGEHIHISAIDKVEIGDNVLTGRYVYISDNNHGGIKDLSLPPASRPLSSKGPVIIGNNVWIGEHVCILSGVRIGNNAIIAANAVVTRDIPDNALVGGIPAVLISK